MAAELDRLADELDARARQREQVGDDNGDPCEDECQEVTCHTVAAVATWGRAAGIVRRRAAELRGIESPGPPPDLAPPIVTVHLPGDQP